MLLRQGRRRTLLGVASQDMSENKIQELPDMVTQLYGISKEYVLQETVEPAKRIGRTAGMGLAAALLFGIGAILMSIAVLRWIVGALPDTPLWSTAGYGITFVALAAVIGILGWRINANG